MSRDAVIGNARCYPHSTRIARSLTDHFHNPNFIGVGNGERLTIAEITIFLREVGNAEDGLASGGTTLQCYVNQASIIHDAGRIIELMTAAKSGLAYGELLLVHISDYGIRMRYFGDLAQIFIGIPVINFSHRTSFVISSRLITQKTIEIIGVSRIRNHRLTIGRSQSSNQKIGACHSAERQHDCCKRAKKSFHRYVKNKLLFRCFRIEIYANGKENEIG